MADQRTNAENARESSAIQLLIDAAADGATLSWVEIEQQTGVKMDQRGRSLVRRVLSKSRREKSAIRGSGIRLSSADSAVEIVEESVTKIARAVCNASHVTTNVLDRHGKDMRDDDKQKLIRANSHLGAIKAATTDMVKMVLPAKMGALTGGT